MAWLSDGGFTGFLYSMKETGKRLKDGAKERIEDFISGFNGHGWKLWKKNGFWRLELDELLVRRSFTVYEQIISKITAIRGSQSITQGHAKIKTVEYVESADVYEEIVNQKYREDFTNSKWVVQSNAVDTTPFKISPHKISLEESIDENFGIFVKGNVPLESMKIRISNSNKHTVTYAYITESGEQELLFLEADGEYDLPASSGLAEPEVSAGFLYATRCIATIEEIPYEDEIYSSITQKPCYRIQIDEDLNTIVEYDFIRCQNGGRMYHVQVGSVFQYYINIPVSEFESDFVEPDGTNINIPMVGDEIVQFGNASRQDVYSGRHSAIYMHLDDDEPAIDLMTDIYSKDWSNTIKTRIGGNLPGTNGDRGFYCVNGKLLFVDENEETVSVINPDGSASFARGKVSWTKDGDPYFNGDIISGDKVGKRIEINSSIGEILIFDSNNKEVISFGGAKHTKNDFWEGGVSEIVVKYIPYELIVNVGDPTLSKHDMITEEFEIFNDNTQFSYNYSIQGKVGWGYAKMTIILKDLSKGNDITLEEVYLSNSQEINAVYTTVSRTLSKGKYVVMVYANCSNVASLGSANYIKLVWVNFSLDTKNYFSSFFSNGLVLGDSAKNNFTVINEQFNDGSMLNAPDNLINYHLINNYAGIEIKEGIVYTRHSNKGIGGLVDCTVFRGLVNGTNGIGTTFFSSVDGERPGITRVGTSTYWIQYPSSWGLNAISNSVYAFVEPVDYSNTGQAPMVHNISNITSNGFHVNFRNLDGSYQSTDFYMEIKIM